MTVAQPRSHAPDGGHGLQDGRGMRDATDKGRAIGRREDGHQGKEKESGGRRLAQRPSRNDVPQEHEH